MGQFVQQAEPEIVDPVVAQGQSDHRSSVLEPERGAVEIGPRQMRHDHQGDAVFCQHLPGQSRAVFEPAQLCHLPEEVWRDGTRDILRLRRMLVARCQHLPAPGAERVSVHLRVGPHMVVFFR